MLDVEMMTPGEWERFHLRDGEANAADYDWCALAHSDFLVQQRRGWHAAKCTDADQWIVPQLFDLAMKHRMSLTADWSNFWKQIIEVCYQNGHAIGLLTKAEAWAIKEGLVK